MTKDEALKLALEALKNFGQENSDVCKAIKEALAQPEQKPVAWIEGDEAILTWIKTEPEATPLYTTPPQRTWVGLTPQERDEINEQVYGAVPHHVAFHAAIEAKLKEKNA